jgi:hypothetical protein
VVDVNVAICDTSIYRAEAETTNSANASIMIYTLLPRDRIPLEGAYLYGEACSFDELLIGR